MSVPIRYSADEDIQRPPEQQIGASLWITLDGLPLKRVLSYDIERGEVVRIVIDRRGYPLRNPNKPDEYLTQTVRGVVRVEFRDA